MFDRLVKTTLCALALVIAAWTPVAAAAPSHAGEEGRARPTASRGGDASGLPVWLAWLRSVVLGESSSPGDAAGTESNAEDDSDAGPSMDPDG